MEIQIYFQHQWATLNSLETQAQQKDLDRRCSVSAHYLNIITSASLTLLFLKLTSIFLTGLELSMKVFQMTDQEYSGKRVKYVQHRRHLTNSDHDCNYKWIQRVSYKELLEWGCDSCRPIY